MRLISNFHGWRRFYKGGLLQVTSHSFFLFKLSLDIILNLFSVEILLSPLTNVSEPPFFKQFKFEIIAVSGINAFQICLFSPLVLLIWDEITLKLILFFFLSLLDHRVPFAHMLLKSVNKGTNLRVLLFKHIFWDLILSALKHGLNDFRVLS